MEIFILVIVVVFIFVIGCSFLVKDEVVINHDYEACFIKRRMEEKIFINEKTRNTIKENKNIMVLIFTDMNLDTSVRISDAGFFCSKEIKMSDISDCIMLSILLKELSENKAQKEIFDRYGI